MIEQYIEKPVIIGIESGMIYLKRIDGDIWCYRFGGKASQLPKMRERLRSAGIECKEPIVKNERIGGKNE